MAALPQFLWLVITGSLSAFMYGFATGSNDMGNAFGTSVGSKTLTLRQAVVIASIFEFTGALLLGRVTSNVIAGGITSVETFRDNPAAYAYGMVCALSVGSVWQLLCSRFELNVSSTYTIIACIMGFSFVWKGPNSVNWITWDSTLIPPFGGIVPIVTAWVVSPILTGVASFLLMLLIRTVVLRSQNRVVLSIVALPISIFTTTWVNLFFVLTKGAGKTLSSIGSWTIGTSVWVTTVSTFGLTTIASVVACPLLYRHLKMGNPGSPCSPCSPCPSLATNQELYVVTVVDVIPPPPPPPPPPPAEIQPITRVDKYLAKCREVLVKVKKCIFYGVSVDIHESITTDKSIELMHSRAEKFDPQVEYIFSWLQVFSAICVIFAHGANEVGYMSGPLTAIYDIYTTGQLTGKVTPTIWIILISASGLVIGLSTYGYNITRAMGTKLAMLSPSRGFCAELSTALVIMVTSQMGLPVSSSLAVIGGIVGVGLLEGWKTGVNWVLFAKQLGSWIMTMFVCSLTTAGLFAQGVYSPSKS